MIWTRRSRPPERPAGTERRGSISSTDRGVGTKFADVNPTAGYSDRIDGYQSEPLRNPHMEAFAQRLAMVWDGGVATAHETVAPHWSFPFVAVLDDHVMVRGEMPTDPEGLRVLVQRLTDPAVSGRLMRIEPNGDSIDQGVGAALAVWSGMMAAREGIDTLRWQLTDQQWVGNRDAASTIGLGWHRAGADGVLSLDVGHASVPLARAVFDRLTLPSVPSSLKILGARRFAGQTRRWAHGYGHRVEEFRRGVARDIRAINGALLRREDLAPWGDRIAELQRTTTTLCAGFPEAALTTLMQALESSHDAEMRRGCQALQAVLHDSGSRLRLFRWTTNWLDSLPKGDPMSEAVLGQWERDNSPPAGMLGLLHDARRVAISVAGAARDAIQWDDSPALTYVTMRTHDLEDDLNDILTNLMSNALRHRLSRSREPALVAIDPVHAGALQFTVTNVAERLRDDQLRQLGVQGFRTDATREGQGRGLASSINLLHDHRWGELWVRQQHRADGHSDIAFRFAVPASALSVADGAAVTLWTHAVPTRAPAEVNRREGFISLSATPGHGSRK